MQPTNRASVFLSLPNEDLEILNRLSANTGRTRSEIVLTALRGHYEVMRLAYERRVAADIPEYPPLPGDKGA